MIQTLPELIQTLPVRDRRMFRSQFDDVAKQILLVRGIEYPTLYLCETRAAAQRLCMVGAVPSHQIFTIAVAREYLGCFKVYARTLWEIAHHLDWREDGIPS